MDTPVLLRGDLVVESLAPSIGESDDDPHGVAEGVVAGVQQAVLDARYAWLTGFVEELAVDEEWAFLCDAPGT